MEHSSNTRARYITAFAAFLAFMGIGVVDPILPSIAEQIGASHWQVEMLFTSYIVIMAVMMVPSGIMAARLCDSDGTAFLRRGALAANRSDCAVWSCLRGEQLGIHQPCDRGIAIRAERNLRRLQLPSLDRRCGCPCAFRFAESCRIRQVPLCRFQCDCSCRCAADSREGKSA